MWDLSIVFHEKQEMRLCAQHCLNAALQGPYFTAVDLSEIAHGLDEEERQQMSENEKGVESEDYKRFLQQPSENMDDTGFFSVQVLNKAFALWGLDLIPLHSTDEVATDIRSHPTKATAYIFNFNSHWYCIRRFKTDPMLRPSPNDAYAFINLDSLLSRPEYMSSSFLTEYLKQMQNEGYSIFIVSGEFPECAADPIRYIKNAAPTSTTTTAAAAAAAAGATQIIDLSKSDSKSSVLSEQDEDIQRAIRLSLAEYTNKYDRYQLPSECVASSNSVGGDGDCDDNASAEYNADLDAALKLSLDCFGGSSDGGGANQEMNAGGGGGAAGASERLTQSQLRDKRLAYFSAMSSNEK